MRHGRAEGRWPLKQHEQAWERFMLAERRALASRAEGHLARALGEALPGESREELDQIAEEDRRLAREGLVPLMDDEGELYHKHVDELGLDDVADRVRAETALCDWLVSRTDQRLELLKVPRPSTRSRPD